MTSAGKGRGKKKNLSQQLRKILKHAVMESVSSKSPAEIHQVILIYVISLVLSDSLK